MRIVYAPIIAALLGGCIFPPVQTPIIEPTPTVLPEPKPTSTLPPPIGPYPIPTVDDTPFHLVLFPNQVRTGEEFRIEVTAKEYDNINVLVDGYQVGKMFWDAERRIKYLDVKLNTGGERKVSFRVNGIVIHSQPLLVMSL